MQIKLTLRPRGGRLYIPFNYNHQLQSAVYAKLRCYGVSDMLHDSGFYSDRLYKAFVFGSLNGPHTTGDGHFLYTKDISFEFRSPIFEFCDAFQRSIEDEPEIKLFDTYLDVTGASLGNVHFKSGTAVFKTGSPVTVFQTEPDGKTTYFSPETPEFAEHLIGNYRRKYMAVVGSEPEEIEIAPILPQRKIVTSFKNTWITCFKGEYTVTGSSGALEFIYNAGLGAKNSQGFGMLDAK